MCMPEGDIGGDWDPAWFLACIAWSIPPVESCVGVSNRFLRLTCVLDLTLFLLLMTSVLSDIGRGRPCSLRKRPQALQRVAPDSSRLQRGVVEVEQFWQTGGLTPAIEFEGVGVAAGG